MTILILGGADDDHARQVLERLTARGADAELLDSRDFPERTQVAYRPGQNDGELSLPHGRSIPFAGIRSVYWRSYAGPRAAPLPDPEQAYIATNDARSLFESILINLRARWVNGWKAFQLHQTKPVQLAIVAQLGVDVPETLLANHPDAVREFAARVPCIFKPVQGGAHARELTPDLLTDEALSRLRLAPVTIQEAIPGTNIRVFVAGSVVDACEIEAASLDFRDDPRARLRVHALPDDSAEQSRRIAEALDLVWTGIDYRLTADGRYVFLEANPSPMFLGFEAATGLPLTERLLALLTEA
ncbi:MAG: hypothetical protein KF774_10745 [Planctomyces sp.]|nr:hypothetical protein [Planctomyces sp.]